MNETSHSQLTAGAWARPKPFGAGFLVATVLVFLQFGPHVAWLLRDTAREWHLWQVRDTLHLFGFIAVLGLAFATAGALIRRFNRPWLTTLAEHAVMVALGAGLITNLWYHTDRPHGYHIAQHGMETATLWAMLIAVTGYSLARPELRLAARARTLCLILSPGLLIVLGQFLYMPAYPESMDPFPPASGTPVRPVSASQKDLHPVYVIIFDEWSYRRTFENGAVRLELANLAALSSQAVVFHRAISPSNMTEYSIPRMLFGVDWKVSLGVKGYGFEVDGRFSHGREHDSIFRDASSRGYRTVMIGAAFPFRLLLGDQVDVCRAHCWLEGTRSRNRLFQGAVDLYDAAGYWADPWTPFVRGKIGPDWSARLRACSGYERLNSDLMEIINRQPADTFAVVHYPTPHAPYVMNEDGRPCPRGEVIWASCKDEMHRKGYQRNLKYLDYLVGRITAGLRQRGLFEKALLIITSDHDWRADPEHHPKWAEHEYREVPLLVKMPGQESAVAIDEPFQTKHLGRLIRFALGPDGRPEEVPSLIRQLREMEKGGRTAPALAARPEPAR